mmetsp:Transcript_97994/g.227248  ORF Transcript_97994/g.227248 Transcript_97994/m.227248 type:complete len:214 (+) Transcript_97994:318-959(+)
MRSTVHHTVNNSSSTAITGHGLPGCKCTIASADLPGNVRRCGGGHKRVGMVMLHCAVLPEALTKPLECVLVQLHIHGVQLLDLVNHILAHQAPPFCVDRLVLQRPGFQVDRVVFVLWPQPDFGAALPALVGILGDLPRLLSIPTQRFGNHADGGGEAFREAKSHSFLQVALGKSQKLAVPSIPVERLPTIVHARVRCPMPGLETNEVECLPVP